MNVSLTCWFSCKQYRQLLSCKVFCAVSCLLIKSLLWWSVRVQRSESKAKSHFFKSSHASGSLTLRPISPVVKFFNFIIPVLTVVLECCCFILVTMEMTFVPIAVHDRWNVVERSHHRSSSAKVSCLFSGFCDVWVVSCSCSRLPNWPFCNRWWQPRSRSFVRTINKWLWTWAFLVHAYARCWSSLQGLWIGGYRHHWGEPQASPTVTCWLGFLSRYIYKYIYISTGRPLSLIRRPAWR